MSSNPKPCALDLLSDVPLDELEPGTNVERLAIAAFEEAEATEKALLIAIRECAVLADRAKTAFSVDRKTILAELTAKQRETEFLRLRLFNLRAWGQREDD